MATSSQKFIARNRAPRVQIEYDVELYGAEKKVQLPFVMGVMADLTGKPAEPLAPVADRKFLDIDVDNFDERMKALQALTDQRLPGRVNRLSCRRCGEADAVVLVQSSSDRDPGQLWLFRAAAAQWLAVSRVMKGI